MNKEQAKKLIIDTFENPFDKNNFIFFLKNLLKSYEEKPFVYQGNYIPDAFEQHISSLERIGKYSYDDKEIDLLIVQLKRETSLERARTMQRNFIAWYLKGSRGGKLKDAALVAFVSPGLEDWRFSLVKMDYRFEETPSGKIKVKEEFTPARRWSFLVGKNEKSHTAHSRFLPILENDGWHPTLENLEQAFNVEVVTKEFFEKYRDLFIKTKKELDKIVQKDIKVKQEFQNKNINTVDFAKKLLGQIAFLYFLQKKGWFGVERGKPWGGGPRDFIRRLFNKEFWNYQNFYNDILEPLFYEALRTDRSSADHYYSRFNCKLPFLNGGLFDPINNFDWVNVDIMLPNELFSNTNRTKEGDTGDGILDVFDRYNFTVNEEEPLEKEVALDPELLGKIYEKLNAIRADNFDEYVRVLKSGKKGEETKFNKEYGVYYTPREIVHYMCQESLINYLESSTGIPACDIEKFVKISDSVKETEIIAFEKEEKIKSGKQKSTRYESQIPESVRQNAEVIDNLLAEIKVCDPAVGSGAFPIGMMHEIVKLRQLLSVYRSTDIPVCENSKPDIPVCENNKPDIPICDNTESDNLRITRRKLPHWTKPGSIYWVTFRLSDSLPQEKISQWKEEYEIWLKHNPKPWDEKQWQEYNERFGERMENWLDKGYGSCILAKTEVRNILKECLFKFDGERHRIHAVVIMPNHIHLLIEPFSGYLLSDLLKGIKGTSAYHINKLLHSTGSSVWAEESYDHIVRSEKEYVNFVNYIMNNPPKAGLSQDKYLLYVSQTFLSVEKETSQARMPVLPSVPQTTTQARMPVLRSTYELKRHCIENSLYGVDIDPGAVEICKLRFWLSMIVDEEDFYNIKPLPNLDYKVVCGDSLLGVEKDLFNQQAFARLEKLKPQYFNETHPLKKQELKKQIDNVIFEITDRHKEFDFEVYFSEVFHKKGGFDVVIENPPYVRQERIKNYKPLLQKANYTVFNATSDLYTYFYEKSYKIAKPAGFICMITSNKWMRAKYGEKLRELLRNKTTIKHLIDFNGFSVFEATVDTNIILFQNSQPKNDHILETITIDKDFDINSMENYIKEKSIKMEQKKLEPKCFVIAEDKVLKLKDKIEKIGKPLKDWDVKIYYGIKTGFNEAFIITTEKRDEILANCKDKEERKRTEEIIKPILRGRDIGRYYYKWAGLWVIFIPWHFPLHNDETIQGASNKAEKEFRDQYSVIYKHLLNYKQQLLNRNKDETGIRYEWYAMQRCAATYYPEFEKEKIVWQHVSGRYDFAYVKSGMYLTNALFMITGEYSILRYILGILNSKFADQLFLFFTNLSTLGKYAYGAKDKIELLPIPPITPQNQPIAEKIESLVSQILSLTQSTDKNVCATDTDKNVCATDTNKNVCATSNTGIPACEDKYTDKNVCSMVKELEKQIDQLVYELYGLTEEEIKIVEGG